MQLIHLPPDVVPYLNGLWGGSSAVEEDLAAFLAVRDAAAGWLAFHATYSVDDEEAALLGNIGNSWDEAVAAPDLSSLLPSLYAAVGAMDHVRRGRERPDYSRQPPVNDLLRAGAALLQSRGSREAIAARVPVVEGWLRNLDSMYEGTRDRLRPEITPDLEVGFRHMRDGLQAVAVGADTNDNRLLEDGLGQLHAGAGLVQHFLDWDLDDQRRLAERHSRFNIPAVGPQLELGLIGARKTPRACWGPAVTHTLQVYLPTLRGVWERLRPGLMLPSELLEECRSAVDFGIDALEAALAGLLDETVEEAVAADRFEDALLALSAAFDTLDREALRQDAIAGTGLESYWELVGGLLAGTVPNVAVEEMLRVSPPVGPAAELGVKLRMWLMDADPAHVLAAVDVLIACAGVTSEQPLPSTWTCGPCGQTVPVGATTCPRCGAHAQSPLDSSSWEA